MPPRQRTENCATPLEQPRKHIHQQSGDRHGNAPATRLRESVQWSTALGAHRAGSRSCELTAMHPIRLRRLASCLWSAIRTHFVGILVYRW
jgi:hypothetical protein